MHFVNPYDDLEKSKMLIQKNELTSLHLTKLHFSDKKIDIYNWINSLSKITSRFLLSLEDSDTFNFRKIVDMVKRAYSLDATLWLKPLEIHNDIHKKYSILKEDQNEYKKLIREALDLAKTLKIRIVATEYQEAIINDSPAI
jgi:uncharacterized protein YxjI